jgi:hypothetical protein
LTTPRIILTPRRIILIPFHTIKSEYDSKPCPD